MKKIMLIAGLLFCSQTIFAQLEKGLISVGLTSNFSTTDRKDDTNSPSTLSASNYSYKTTTYNVAPTVSYFLSKRFAVGISIGYAGYQTITETTSNDFSLNTKGYTYEKTVSNGTTISPYVKYYIPMSEHVYFLLKAGYASTFSVGNTSGYNEDTQYDGSGNVTSVTRSNEYGPNKTKTSDINVGLSPGVLFMPTKKIGLEFSLGNLLAYNSTIAKTTNNTGGGTTKSTNSGLQIVNFNTISIGTGIYYFF
jgi:hypothetical protein